jgi:hypothetical protein
MAAAILDTQIMQHMVQFYWRSSRCSLDEPLQVETRLGLKRM